MSKVSRAYTRRVISARGTRRILSSGACQQRFARGKDGRKTEEVDESVLLAVVRQLPKGSHDVAHVNPQASMRLVEPNRSVASGTGSPTHGTLCLRLESTMDGTGNCASAIFHSVMSANSYDSILDDPGRERFAFIFDTKNYDTDVNTSPHTLPQPACGHELQQGSQGRRTRRFFLFGFEVAFLAEERHQYSSTTSSASTHASQAQRPRRHALPSHVDRSPCPRRLRALPLPRVHGPDAADRSTSTPCSAHTRPSASPPSI